MLLHALVNLVGQLGNPRRLWREIKQEQALREEERKVYEADAQAVRNLLERMPEAHRALAQDLTPAQILDGLEAVALWLDEEMDHQGVPESSLVMDGTLSIGSQHVPRHDVLFEIAQFTGMWKDGVEGGPPDPKTNLLLDWILKALETEPNLFERLILDQRHGDRFVFISRPVEERERNLARRWAS